MCVYVCVCVCVWKIYVKNIYVCVCLWKNMRKKYIYMYVGEVYEENMCKKFMCVCVCVCVCVFVCALLLARTRVHVYVYIGWGWKWTRRSDFKSRTRLLILFLLVPAKLWVNSRADCFFFSLSKATNLGEGKTLNSNPENMWRSVASFFYYQLI